jgi:mRNA interferase MazF
MQRGDIWWANLPAPASSGPGYRRPVLVVQANAFTQSRIATIVVIVISCNLRLAAAPGNVLLRTSESGLPKDSVVNASQIVTIDKLILDEYIGHVSLRTLEAVEQGLRLVLDL